MLNLQQLMVILVLLISGTILAFIFDKLKLKVTKIIFITFLALLLLYFPLFYFDRNVIVRFIQQLFDTHPVAHELFSIYLANAMFASTYMMFIVAIIMVSLVIIMLAVLLVVTLRATYKLILVIRDFFKKKPITPTVEIEKFNLSKIATKYGDENNLYLKFCRLLN